MQHWAEIEGERRDLVDQVDGVTEEQWEDLRGAWTVRDVLAHLLSRVTPGVKQRLVVAMMKDRDDFDRTDQCSPPAGGVEGTGPAPASALALLGRTARLDHLEGPGVPVLTKWLPVGEAPLAITALVSERRRRATFLIRPSRVAVRSRAIAIKHTETMERLDARLLAG
jgi:hypothetical protein